MAGTQRSGRTRGSAQVGRKGTAKERNRSEVRAGKREVYGSQRWSCVSNIPHPITCPSCRIFSNSKGLQFYSELSGLMSTLRRDAQEFISTRKSERDSLVAQAETQRRLSGLGTLHASPPAKPPPPPSSLDQVFSSLTLKSTPVSPGPPPPPPPASWASPASWTPPASWTAAQKAAYSGQPNLHPPLTQPYSSPSAPTSQSPPFIPPPPPPSQLPHVPPPTRAPYPPTPPVQSPYGVGPSQPARDPYAGLASLGSTAHFLPPPTPQRQASYPVAGQQQSQTYQSLSSPGHTVYTYTTTPSLPVRQGSTGSALPPPPPPVSYSQPPPPQSYGVGVRPPYGVSPPPAQQQPYGGYSQYGR
jgi:hypothetical protein